MGGLGRWSCWGVVVALQAGGATALAQPRSIVGPERDTDPLLIAPANNNAPPVMACGDDRCAVSNAVVDATTGAILSRDWPGVGDLDCHGQDCLIAGPDIDQKGFLRLERASLATSAVATSRTFPFPPGASANGLTKISCPGPTCVLAWTGATHWVARIDLATAMPLDPEWIPIDAPSAIGVAAAMDCTDKACLIALAHDLGSGVANGLGAYELDLQTGRVSLTFSRPAEGEPGTTNYYYRNVGCAGDRCLIVFAPGYHRSTGDPISALAVDMLSGSVGPKQHVGFTSTIPSEHFELGSYALACTGGRCLLTAPFRAEQWLDLETGAPSGAVFGAVTQPPRSEVAPWTTYHAGVACKPKGCIVGRTMHVVNTLDSPGLGNLVISRVDPSTPTTTPGPLTIVSLVDNWQRDPRVSCSGTSCLVLGLDNHSYGWQTWVNGKHILAGRYTPLHWPFAVRFDAASGETFGERSLISGDTEWGAQGTDPFCGQSSCAIVAGNSVPEGIVSFAGSATNGPWSGLQRKLGLTCTEAECFAWGRRSADPADAALASTRLDLTARTWAPLADVAGIATVDASSCERTSCLFVSRDSTGVVSGRRVVLGGTEVSAPMRIGEAAAAGTLTVSCAGGTCLVSWIDQQGAVHASAVQLAELEVAAVAGGPIASAAATKVTAGCRPGECLLAWLGATGPTGENDVFGARVATERAAFVDTTPLALVSSPQNERAVGVAPADDQRYVLVVERVHPDGNRIKVRVVDFLSRFPPEPDAGAGDVPAVNPDGGAPDDAPAVAGDAGAGDVPSAPPPDAPTQPSLDGGSGVDGGRTPPASGDGCTCQLERAPKSSAMACFPILALVASMLRRWRRRTVREASTPISK
jgi:hypothetical protein